MESLFNTNDYRDYMAAKIKSYPKSGYGLMGKLAAHIQVHPSLVSQIIKGEKALSPDQALAIADFFGLTDLEADYFLLLVQRDRAGTRKLKEHLDRKLLEIKEKSSHLVNRLKAEKNLSEEAKGIFYSDWTYSAIRQMTALVGVDTVEVISEKLGLPLKEVRKILEFLEAHGLCVLKNGRYAVGPQSTHLASTSPWARVQHRNWREKAIEQIRKDDQADLFFTCPLTIGNKDIERVRELVIKLIDEVYKIVDPSPSEALCCLNIDWFRAIQK